MKTQMAMVFALALVLVGSIDVQAASQYSTTTLLSCSPSVLDIGSQATCTATVIGSASSPYGAATGLVTFTSSAGSGTFGSGNCALSSGACQTTYSDGTAGTDTVTASYGGDSNYASSSATQSVSVGPLFCNQFFASTLSSTKGSTPLSSIFPSLGVASFSSYGNIIPISIAIVGMVFAVLAILYGIGYAFGLPRVIALVKTEYLESVFNLVIIIAIAGGSAAIASGVAFIANLGGAAVAATNAGTATVVSAGPSSIDAIYSSICSAYSTDAISHIGSYASLIILTSVIGDISSFQVNLHPNGAGVGFTPFFGVTPLLQALYFIINLSYGVVGIEIGVIFFLALLYYLLPIFLFAGLLFRSFPWTRAAGGTLLALFIGFYLFFPALVYPFTTVTPATLHLASYCGSAAEGDSGISQFICANGGQGGTQVDQVNVLTNLKNVVFSPATSFLTGGEFSGLLDFYIAQIIFEAFQLFGIIIAFVIAYTLLEAFADLLGAPSLSSRDILRKVI